MFSNKLIAHRGIFDNEKVVENTIESFKEALRLHYPIELDVQLTEDNQIVVFHDTDISRLTNQTGILQTMKYEELKKIPLLSTKSHIPLLKEVLELNQDKEMIDIEVKPTKRMYDTIFYLMKELNGYKNFIIKSFDPKFIRLLKKNYPDITCGLLIHDHYPKFYQKIFLHSSWILPYSRCDFVAISKKILKNKRMMNYLKCYPILVWTIKDSEEVNYQNSLTYICNNLPYKNKKDS